MVTGKALGLVKVTLGLASFKQTVVPPLTLAVGVGLIVIVTTLEVSVLLHASTTLLI